MKYTIYIIEDDISISRLLKEHIDKYGLSERYVSPLGSKTFIYKLTASSVSAKEKEVILDRMFYNGRTIHTDRE